PRTARGCGSPRGTCWPRSTECGSGCRAARARPWPASETLRQPPALLRSSAPLRHAHEVVLQRLAHRLDGDDLATGAAHPVQQSSDLLLLGSLEAEDAAGELAVQAGVGQLSGCLGA